MYKFTLIGNIVSKKNTWKRSRWGGTYQSKQKEIDDLIMQLKTQTRQYTTLPIKTQCRAEFTLWQSDRNDLDNQICTLLDILQTVGIVENDRLVKEIVAKKIVENKNQRCEITIN